MKPVRRIWNQLLAVAIVTAAARRLPAQAIGQPAHIEILLQSRNQDTSDSHRERELRKLNLQLSAGTTKIPYRLASAADGVFATHLLIVLPGPVSDCTRTAAPPKLASFLAKGWSLALAGEDHGWTDWASGPNAWTIACASAAHAASSPEGPWSMLRAQVGRRVLVFAEVPPPSELRQAEADVPEVYLVDGGKETWPAGASPTLPATLPVPAPGPLDTQFPPPSTVPVGFAAETMRRDPARTSTGRHGEGYQGGAWHARSLDSALRAVQRASDLYYDVAFTAPPGASGGAPIQLKFRFIDDFTAHTTLYSESQPANPAMDVRTEVNQVLVAVP